MSNIIVEDFKTVLQSVDKKLDDLSAQLHTVSRLVNTNTKNLERIMNKQNINIHNL